MLRGDCLIKEGKIAGIGSVEVAISDLVSDPPQLDAEENYVAPGFVDLHVHGGGGGDFLDADPEAIRRILAFHAAHGTTGLLATLATSSVSEMRQALKVINSLQLPGILGVYLEGPFLSRAKKGAQNEGHLLPPSVNTFHRLVKGFQQLIKIVAFAPELRGSDKLLGEILAMRATPSIAHTAASYDQVMEAIALGAREFTHLFNAMTGLHHRDPGAVGAAFTAHSTALEIIADGIHIHPWMIRFLVEWLIQKGQLNRLCLITDAIRAAGMQDGSYTLGGLLVTMKKGEARLEDGTLAGSALTMDKAVRNIMEFAGLPIAEAIQLATANPAQTLGLGTRKGSIQIGADGDLVILDGRISVKATIQAGQLLFRDEEG
jgi:N-acetylglucosamine-6-phosphate deacetylase